MWRSKAPKQSQWLLSWPIIRAMQGIDGFLSEEQGDLLLAAAARALTMPGSPGTVVEIGSYCGKSTVVFGLVAKTLRPEARVYAIDPHEGMLSTTPDVLQVEPTFARFQRNMETAGLEQVVVPIRACSAAVPWDKPISLLFIDALHDYQSVSQDFLHFASWVVPHGYVAFHDYGNTFFPDVTRFVDEVIASGNYPRVQGCFGLAILEKQDVRRKVLGMPLPVPRVVSDLWAGPSRTWARWRSAAARRRDARVSCIEEEVAACAEVDEMQHPNTEHG